MNPIQSGLTRFLSERFADRVEVSGITESSAGARRLNVLFDATLASGKRYELCATIIGNVNILIQPIAREAAVLRLAESAGMPVAHVYFDCEDASYLGGPFFISQRIAGETVPRRVLRMVEQVGHGERIVAQIGAAFAALHRVPLQHAPDDMTRPQANSACQQALDNLGLQIKELLQPSPAISLGYRWLNSRMPARDNILTVIHADTRNGNIVISKSGLEAILDWEGSRIGDPMEDLAWPCVRTWRFGEDEKEFGGLGSVETLATAYEGAGGRFEPEVFHWWKVLGNLRWAIGLAGQAHQHLDGRVPNIVMAASGRRVCELEYDLLCLLSG